MPSLTPRPAVEPQSTAESSSASAATSVRPRRRLPYSWPHQYLPEWFSEEAESAAKNKPATTSHAVEVDDELIDFLIKTEAPNKSTYADLLRLVGTVDTAFGDAVYAERLRAYKKLPWLDRLAEDKPVRQTRARKSMDISVFEESEPNPEARSRLFVGLCELHDRKLIRLSGEYPYRIWITEAGRKALQKLQEFPPGYPGRQRMAPSAEASQGGQLEYRPADPLVKPPNYHKAVSSEEGKLPEYG